MVLFSKSRIARILKVLFITSEWYKKYRHRPFKLFSTEISWEKSMLLKLVKFYSSNVLDFFTGVTPVEIMTAHVLTQLLVMVVQVGLLLVFTLAVFKVWKCKTSLNLKLICSNIRGYFRTYVCFISNCRYLMRDHWYLLLCWLYSKVSLVWH